MYPVWEVPYLTGGIIIAIIATFHILPSHLSVGAMWFNLYLETKAVKENNDSYYEFISKYSLLLLIFAYVFGSLSGIGIWFATMVANPRGISALIHNYVWGWATEWVFFIVEVTGIFVYYYTLHRVDRKTHLKIGWIFAIASWATMVIIVGILSFMLTPGEWLSTGNFFEGFFNESYFPHLLTRTGFMFAVAGVYAVAVGTRLKNETLKNRVLKSASLMGIAGIIASVLFGYLYIKTLPENVLDIFNTPQVVSQTLKTMTVLPLAIVFLFFFSILLKEQWVNLPVSIIAIVVLFLSIWNGERIRESIRKPYVVPQYMTSNQFIVKDMVPKGVKSEREFLSREGLLKSLPFVPEKLKNPEKREDVLNAGKLIALIECNACHTLNRRGLRPLSKIIKRLDMKDPEELSEFLTALGDYPFMPPFIGSEKDRKFLAEYLSHLISSEENGGEK